MNLLHALHEERRTRVKRHFASVVTAMENLSVALDKPAHFSGVRSSRYTYAICRLLDTFAASKGRVPEYLSAPVTVEPVNPYLDFPDQGSSYFRGLVQDAGDRLGWPATQDEKMAQGFPQSLEELGGKTLDELKTLLTSGRTTPDLWSGDGDGEIQEIPKGHRPTGDGLQSTFVWGSLGEGC